MSWRETLGVAEPDGELHTQNSQNTQNTPLPGDSADIADSALEVAEGTEARLLKTLTGPCQNLSVTPAAVREALAPEDVKDWHNGKMKNDTLAAFAQALAERREMDEGRRPAHYTETATCKHCGPIWLWCRGEVLGCPWCWNRVAGKPIPRPGAVTPGEYH